MPAQTAIDAELEDVAAAIHHLDTSGARTAQVFRDTFDQLYDGQQTGRYRWNQLYNTEKKHFGQIVKMNLHREFKFEDGTKFDWRIAGVDVDCNYSEKEGGWMLPPESLNHLCLLLWAEDTPIPAWSMGLVRVTDERLNEGSHRGGKRTLNDVGRKSITWLVKNAPLPPNVLLQLDTDKVEMIMALKGRQKRINELFRSAQGRIVGRAAVATVGRQDDYMKRLRANGGARTALKAEGIVILGQYQCHGAIARALGLAVPVRGESISVRLFPEEQPGPGVAEINGKPWRIARQNDPVVAAPDLPKI